MANPMVQFKFGVYDDFSALKEYEAGALYITTDEQGIYFAKPVAEGETVKPIKLGNIITYETVEDFKSSTKPPYSADVFYYIEKDNALFKWRENPDGGGGSFVQLNSSQDSITGDINDLKADIGNRSEGTTGTLWQVAESAISSAATAKTAATVADGKATAAQDTATEALNKSNTNAGDIANINISINSIDKSIEELQGIVIEGNNSNTKLRDDIAANGTAALNAQTKANDAYDLAQSAKEEAEANTAAIGDDDTSNSIKGRIKANETSITDIETAIGDDNTLNSIKGRIKANEISIATINTDITNIKSNYATKEQVAADINTAKTAANNYTDSEVESAKKSLIGTETTGNTSTIKGVKKYTDEQIGIVNTSIITLRDQIGNLSNVMNFRGVVDSLDEITDPINGDVIIKENIEYVYVHSLGADPIGWVEFGTVTEDAARFKSIEDAAEALTNRVTALDETNGRVAKIEEDVSTNATAINTQKGRIDTLVDTTIPEINNKIGFVDNDKNLAQMIADEKDRAEGIENGLRTDINTVQNTTIPTMQTAHNELKERVTALDNKPNGRVAVAESDISTLKTKTGIGSLAESETLYGLITAEVARASAEEKKIRDDFAESDAIIETKINDALTWGTFS